MEIVVLRRCTTGLRCAMPLGVRFLVNQPNRFTMQASERRPCGRHFEHSLAIQMERWRWADSGIDVRISEMRSVAESRCNYKAMRSIGVSLAAIRMSGWQSGGQDAEVPSRETGIHRLLSPSLLPTLTNDGCRRPLSDGPQTSLLSRTMIRSLMVLSRKQQASEGQFVVRGAVDRLNRSEPRQKKAAAAAEIDAKKPLLCSPPSVILIL